MSTLGKLPFSWLMVFQLLSRELPEGWCGAVPLLLAPRAPGPAGLSGEGQKPVELDRRAERGEPAAGG